jgi:hypothetical protein
VKNEVKYFGFDVRKTSSIWNYIILLDVFEMTSVSNLKEAIVEALTSLGGSGSISEVRSYINSKYPNKWKDIGTTMADLCPQSTSSTYPQKDRVLERIGRGKYRLRKKSSLVSRTGSIKEIRDSAVSISLKTFSFKEAEEILQKKGQLSIILRAASLNNLSSKKDHNQLQYFFHKNRWDIEVSLFPVITYKLDGFKEKTGIEIERSLIDAIHRSLFRCQWAHAKGKLDVLVFIVPTYKEPKFEQVKRDINEFKEIIPYPVYLVGVPPTQL